MKRIKFWPIIVVLLAIFCLDAKNNQTFSAASSIKDVMSSSQLSFFARIDGTNSSAGNSIFKIQTSGNPSNTTSNLFIGDTLSIGNTNGGSDIYTVTGVASTADIEVNTQLAANNVFNGSYLIATRSAIHTISFTPTSSVASGIWQVLIKASNLSNEKSNDGIPDQGGFDLGATTPTSGATGLGTRLVAADITCPWGATASVGTTVVLTVNEVSATAAGSYHLVSCTLALGTTNPVGDGSTGTIIIGRTLDTGSQLINPSAAVSHIEGRADSNADTYTFFLRHTYGDGTLISSNAGKIAVFENVRVTAPVDPTITFFIDAPAEVGVGQTRCGSPLGAGAVNTTATTINYGSLRLLEFNDLAQRFSCTTNAQNGYIIQAYENSTLTNTITGTTIPDTDCDNGTACSISLANVWTTDVGSSRSEFGFSLEAIGSGQDLPFSDSNYRPFGIGPNYSQTIMSRDTTPDKIDQAYICYRVTASNFQEAGDYENSIIFLATASF